MALASGLDSVLTGDWTTQAMGLTDDRTPTRAETDPVSYQNVASSPTTGGESVDVPTRKGSTVDVAVDAKPACDRTRSPSGSWMLPSPSLPAAATMIFPGPVRASRHWLPSDVPSCGSILRPEAHVDHGWFTKGRGRLKYVRDRVADVRATPVEVQIDEDDVRLRGHSDIRNSCQRATGGDSRHVGPVDRGRRMRTMPLIDIRCLALVAIGECARSPPAQRLVPQGNDPRLARRVLKGRVGKIQSVVDDANHDALSPNAAGEGARASLKSVDPHGWEREVEPMMHGSTRFDAKDGRRGSEFRERRRGNSRGQHLGQRACPRSRQR